MSAGVKILPLGEIIYNVLVEGVAGKFVGVVFFQGFFEQVQGGFGVKVGRILAFFAHIEGDHFLQHFVCRN